MIDTASRNKLAEEIRHFIEGSNTNFDYDDVVYEIKTKDIGVIEIRKNIWLTYDDLKEHKLNGKWKLTSEEIEIIKRAIVFLKSNIEYKWPNWPFLYRITRPIIWLLSFSYLSKKLDHHFNGNGDLTVWPFMSEEEYAYAKSNPVYCAKNT